MPYWMDESPQPFVGQGVTELHWTDRTSHTVIRVLSPTRIEIQEDRVRYNRMGYAESIEQDPNGPIRLAKRQTRGRHSGVWKVGVNHLRLNRRDPYYDPSF